MGGNKIYVFIYFINHNILLNSFLHHTKKYTANFPNPNLHHWKSRIMPHLHKRRLISTRSKHTKQTIPPLLLPNVGRLAPHPQRFLGSYFLKSLCPKVLRY